MPRNADIKICKPDEPEPEGGYSVEEEDYLYICSSAEDTCFNCMGCPCLDAHTHDDGCVGSELGCDTCQMIPEHDILQNQIEYNECHPWAAMNEALTVAYWKGALKKFSEPLKFEKIFLGNTDNRTIMIRRYGTFTADVQDENNSHMADALMYGLTAQRIWYDEAQEEVQRKTKGRENPDGTSDGVASGQNKILTEKET